MATRNFIVFDEFALDLGKAAHDFSADDLKLAMTTASAAPSQQDVAPRWGDYSGNEVSGTGYTAGGESLTSVSWTRTTNKMTLTSGGEPSVSWAQNGAGPTNCRFLILYNDDAPNDEAIGFVDLIGVASLQEGPITVMWDEEGIFVLEVEILPV